MIAFYIAIIIVTGFWYLISQGQDGKDLGDIPISLYTEFTVEFKSKTTTRFGQIVLTLLWLIWLAIVWPWIMLGRIFIVFPKKLHSLMYITNESISIVDISTFIGYTYAVAKNPDEPYISTAVEHEEYLTTVEDFLEEMKDFEETVELLQALKQSDVTDVLILRGW